MTVAERFGANLRRVRKQTGLSQEETALRASLNRTEVGLVERGERLPRIDTVVKLAGALGASLADLTEGIEWTPGETRPGQFALPGKLPCGHA